MNMFVFRRTKGEGGRDPVGSCPTYFNIKKLEKDIRSSKIIHIKNGDEVQYILDELHNGRLRQGWGFSNPDLDLNLPDNEWAEHFALGSYKYWGRPLSKDICKYAMGRKNILNNMLDMQKGDIIFLPKTPDNNHFKVTTVKKRYKFDNDIVVPEDDFRNDFRHLIGVEKTITFQYSKSTLESGVFSAPFLHAIDPINPDYETYQLFKNFITENYI